jgi:hypothetical protein
MKQKTSMIDQALQGRKPALNGASATGARNTAMNSRPGGQPEMQIPKQQPGMEEGDPDFDALVEELTALISEGKLPENFDLTTACQDPAFVELINEFPAEAAVRIYDAEKRADEAEQNAMQRVNTQMRARGGLPRSQRGGAMSAPAPDYGNMDEDAFKDLLFNVKKTARSGGKARL